MLPLALQAVSPYVTRVYEFVPAPGQFVNVMPEWLSGDDQNAMLDKATTHLAGQANGQLLSLGAYGGYVVVGFDHTIANIQEVYDFKIYGNAFTNSAEPGVVMVSHDANDNGLPDDTWYEIAGSEYTNPSSIQNYEIVYYKPSDELEASTGALTNYILWRDNQGQTGYVSRNSFHTQSYFPQWITSDSLVFRGTRLPPNTVQVNGIYELRAYEWGYADNQPNNSDGSSFKIDWAVDAAGNPVVLPGVDFIKIYTGVNQNNGWVGECSTEVSGVADLHTPTALPDYHTSSALVYTAGQQLTVENSNNEPIQIFTVSGVCVAQSAAVKQASFQMATPGVYLVKIGNAVQKVIIRY